MNKTKKKIISVAIQLFNEKGVSNVRNQDISKAADISLSNFNYHFKTKKELIFEVCSYMVAELQAKVYGNSVLVSKAEQSLEITKSFFEFEKRFKFFYLDTYNILQSYPSLKELLQLRISEAIQIIKNLNFLAIGKGTMLPEPADMPGLYDRLAEQIWINNHFWFAQMHIRGDDDNVVIKGMEANFVVLYPYLTEKGRAAHRTFIQNLKDNTANK
jgi:AcrR family transcriptional regulator